MTLSELKARVDAAVGGDREIDLALALIHFPNTTNATWLTDELERVAFGSQRPYTSSLDAALGLVEAKMPGMSAYLLDKAIRSAAREGVAWHEGTPQRITLAFLSALLSALMAEEVPA